MSEFGICILGGGEATRLPGKLVLPVDDVPMIVRVYRNMRATGQREIVVSCKATYAPDVDALLPVPAIVDRWPGRGPLAGMLAAFGQMRSRFVFAVAGDAPFVDDAFVASVVARAERDDEAVVPVRVYDRTFSYEPLAALYDRVAFVREGMPVLRSGRGSLRAALDGLRARFVPMSDGLAFTNVNSPDDYAALRARFTGDTA